MLQGVLCWVWSAVLVFAFAAPNQHFTPLDGVAVAVWLVGFVFQAGGDRQLARFKRDPANKGKLFQGGLWSLTRHPNYFGEAVMWWAYFLFALAHPWGFITIVSPLYATWFMASGSAAPGNERHMRKTRPDYEDYARRVPQFFPWRFSARPGRTRRRRGDGFCRPGRDHHRGRQRAGRAYALALGARGAAVVVNNGRRHAGEREEDTSALDASSRWCCGLRASSAAPAAR